MASRSHMAPERSLAELKRRTVASGGKALALFERLYAVDLAAEDPRRPRSRLFMGSVAVKERRQFRPPPVEVSLDARGRGGSWLVEMAYHMLTTTEAVPCPPAEDAFIAGDRRTATCLVLRIHDYTDEVIDPFAEEEPEVIQGLPRLDTVSVEGATTSEIVLPAGADKARLEELYVAQRACLGWVGSVGRQLAAS